MRSLRSHVLLGACLWTVGLFAISGVVVTSLLFHHPRAPFLFHLPFRLYAWQLSVLAVVCMVTGFWQVRRGIAAFQDLRARLGSVHEGHERRLLGTYPSEVEPLVTDLNALLEAREADVARAVAKAGDLAHALKTPLALLSREVERADAAGDHAVAEAIAEQVDRMRHQIDYHLARARASAGVRLGVRSGIAESVDALARTLERLHAGRAIRIENAVPAEHAVRIERQDVEEMLGNLLDNACKWAASRIVVSSTVEGGFVVITIDDDGAGLAETMREIVLRRGARADEAASGSGLGLAIVRDLAETFGGSIELQTAPIGGLRARLRLPA